MHWGLNLVNIINEPWVLHPSSEDQNLSNFIRTLLRLKLAMPIADEQAEKILWDNNHQVSEKTFSFQISQPISGRS